MLPEKTLRKEQAFKKTVCDYGCSERVASELWKWYDPVKKGVASF